MLRTVVHNNAAGALDSWGGDRGKLAETTSGSYHRITWISPAPSIESLASNASLKLQYRRTRKLLAVERQRARQARRWTVALRMDPSTKAAIRQQFRNLLDEHDSSADTSELTDPAAAAGQPFALINCPVCHMKVLTALFRPTVLSPCRHVVCEVCSEADPARCPVCAAPVVHVTRVAEGSEDSVSVIDHSDGSPRANPLTEAEQLYVIREAKLNRELGATQYELDQVLEAKERLVSQVESIKREESKVQTEMRVLQDKLHSLAILKDEHKDTLRRLRDKEETITIRCFLINRSLNCLQQQKAGQEPPGRSSSNLSSNST